MGKTLGNARMSTLGDKIDSKEESKLEEVEKPKKKKKK